MRICQTTMMEVDLPQFSSKDEEVRYWMELAQRLQQKKEDVERELEEFQENSQMLEKELETSLDQAEKTSRDLRQRNSRLNNENEQLRQRLDQQILENNKLDTRVQEMQKQQEQMIKYIRELEQKNDDLERAHRVIKVTEEEIEAKFNNALEKNALLESELDEKDTLKATVQRLKDEIRDLKLEIQVQNRHQTDNDKSVDRVHNVDSNKLQKDQESNAISTETQTVTASQLKIGNGLSGNGVIGNNNNNINLNPPLPPHTRILAMNMIGDLMRKVGFNRWVCMDCKKMSCRCPEGKKSAKKSKSHSVQALENKLNTCRTATREDVYRGNRRQMRTNIPRAITTNNNFVRYNVHNF